MATAFDSFHLVRSAPENVTCFAGPYISFTVCVELVFKSVCGSQEKINKTNLLFISALLNFYYVFYNIYYIVAQQYMYSLYINILVYWGCIRKFLLRVHNQKPSETSG